MTDKEALILLETLKRGIYNKEVHKRVMCEPIGEKFMYMNVKINGTDNVELVLQWLKDNKLSIECEEPFNPLALDRNKLNERIKWAAENAAQMRETVKKSNLPVQELFYTGKEAAYRDVLLMLKMDIFNIGGKN